MTARRYSLGLFCVSAALLGYELLLMRLLSLAYWGHFAGFIISIALLGLAASGLFLHFKCERIVAGAAKYFSVSAGLFGVTAPLAFGCSQFIPFTPFLLTWSASEFCYLGLRVLVFFVPFFFAGIAIGAPFVGRVLPVARLYCWNMLGSAAPGLPLLAGMSMTHPVRLLIPVSILGLIAALVAATGRKVRSVWAMVALITCAMTIGMPFRYSEYKDLSKTLNLPDAKIISEDYDPNGVVHTVQSPHTRYLPGLSLNFVGELPRSALVFVDGASMEVVFDPRESLRNPEFLKRSPEAFSYSLVDHPRALLLSGGPLEILRGVAHGADEIVSVDHLRRRAEAIDAAWQRFGFPFGQREGLRRVDDEPRHFLATTRETFDVILLSQLDSYSAATAGAASLDPSYLFTVEGLSLIFDHVSPAGHAVFTTWVENPPRAGVRLSALLIEMLRRRGVVEPGRHLLVLRSWSTLGFFVTREPCAAREIIALKRFVDENSFDLVYYPGIREAEANRFNVIPGAPYFAAMQSLLGPSGTEFRNHSPFHVDPPSDDKPFFSHFFRWDALRGFVVTMGADWIPFVEWGYLLLASSLAVALVLGFGILIVPCWIMGARLGAWAALFFLVVGIGYILVEMWAIHRLMYFLSYPMLASAVALTAMLGASGAGAAFFARGEVFPRSRGSLLGGLLGTLTLALLVFPPLAAYFFPQTLAVRLVIGAIWIAVPAFLMGYPFPFALRRLQRLEAIPWALALNGFGSVLGSLMATLLAVHFGLGVLGLIAAGIYLLAALCLLRSRAFHPN